MTNDDLMNERNVFFLWLEGVKYILTTLVGQGRKQTMHSFYH